MVQPFPSTEMIKRSSRFHQVEKAQACQLFPSAAKGQTVQPFPSSGKRSSVPAVSVNRPFPRARREFGTSIALCRLVRQPRAVVQQRRVHGHFTRRSLILDLKVWAKKNGQLVRGTKAELVRCNLSYFIFPQ